MDCPKKADVPNPFETANPVSKLFFFWILPMLRKGKCQDLSHNDMPNVRKEDGSEGLADQLEQ
jgi:hypothetical protein